MPVWMPAGGGVGLREARGRASSRSERLEDGWSGDREPKGEERLRDGAAEEDAEAGYRVRGAQREGAGDQAISLCGVRNVHR